jgi:hypothetical protein
VVEVARRPGAIQVAQSDERYWVPLQAAGGHCNLLPLTEREQLSSVAAVHRVRLRAEDCKVDVVEGVGGRQLLWHGTGLSNAVLLTRDTTAEQTVRWYVRKGTCSRLRRIPAGRPGWWPWAILRPVRPSLERSSGGPVDTSPASLGVVLIHRIFFRWHGLQRVAGCCLRPPSQPTSDF